MQPTGPPVTLIARDGRIVVVGTAAAERYGDTKFALARYSSDGTLDASFDVNGKLMTDFTPRGDGATGVAIQADGKIVAAGMANSGRSKMKVALARYLATAVGSPSTASAVAGSPSPGHAATASSRGSGRGRRDRDRPADGERYRGATVSRLSIDGRQQSLAWPYGAGRGLWPRRRRLSGRDRHPRGPLQGDHGQRHVSDWQIASDANGSGIIASDPATSGQFYVQVKQGQYLKLSGVQIVKAAAAAPTKTRSSVGDGVYLVGTDIPAGRYRGTRGGDVEQGTGRYHATRTAPSASTRPTWAGPSIIHVKKGQYLKLFSVKVRRVK